MHKCPFKQIAKPNLKDGKRWLVSVCCEFHNDVLVDTLQGYLFPGHLIEDR